MIKVVKIDDKIILGDAKRISYEARIISTPQELLEYIEYLVFEYDNLQILRCKGHLELANEYSFVKAKNDFIADVRHLVCMNLQRTCSALEGNRCKMTKAKCVFQMQTSIYSQ